jgi:deoxyribonuclease-4
MSPQSARAVGEVAAARGIRLSAHAPYFINLNAREPEKVTASRERILQTARITSLLGGESIVFHAGFYLKDEPSKVYTTVRRNIEQIVAQLRTEGNRVWIRPEVMGKISAFGTLEEVLELSTEVEGVAPAIDFSHWHARTGKANSYDEFVSILRQIEDKLGRNALNNMHIHISGIDYGAKGERKHLVFAESDFRYVELVRALKDCEAQGLVICESPNLEDDALLLQQTYRAL